ncbi:MAG: flagellar hook-basal body complex protein [Pseudorhodoplanes sp.]|uniref:flagellar hook-basal body complex protein n=1 Tax=Pseudorhodoplanes sp. TaxID=1934341 RepID=UPI003D0B1B21
MGIFGALTTAVTGMRAQSYALENVSGNIANSQTTAFKRIDTSFQDLIPDNIPSKQLAGGVIASARATNTVQGDIQSASVGTFMAINGDGFFVVQKPTSVQDNAPVFGGSDYYTRRGDFQPDKNGYLVNGAGYYLMGLPIDPATGNTTGSVPQLLQFQNDFLPAQQTTSVEYRANLASYPLTNNHDIDIPRSELLNPANFSANPIYGPPSPARVLGSGATLSPDAVATGTGSVDISALASAGGTLEINGTAIAITAGADEVAVLAAINAQTGTTGVTASLNGTGRLVLNSADADTNISIGGASTLSVLSELGLNVGTTNATNLLTQNAVGAGQTMVIQVGGNPALTVTFGTGPGQVSTLAELSTALGAVTGGTGTVDTTNGNVTINAANMTDTISIDGTIAHTVFGMRTLSAQPSNGSVIGNDLPAFINSSIGGGAVTAYDVSGSPVNIQLRWAKVDSQLYGGQDTWNLFYQVNSNATGTQAAWLNAGTSYTFGANGQMNPQVPTLQLSNVTIDGVNLGDIQIAHGAGGITQFADPNGNAQVNLLKQNGFPAGELQTVAISEKGRIVGSYSNGRTIDLAEITLANFNGANFLKRIDGGAFEVTDESGTPTYGASGTIIGSSLEGSNTDIADEFTKLIVTQQAYSANTRVISTTNDMVQDLLNMIR